MYNSSFNLYFQLGINNRNKKIGFYIHFPFCKSRCNYCDFFSTTGKLHVVDDYVDALIKEIVSYEKDFNNHSINTIYFGGGTPSILDSAHILQIIDTLKNNFKISKDVEVTIEVNPDSANRQKLDNYLKSGINRISIGLQAWQNNLLKILNRPHTQKDFTDVYKKCRKVGFENINVDLIFGFPKQTFENWRETLEKVIELKPRHISCYSLELDNNSKWGRLNKNNRLPTINDELDRKMYWHAVHELKKAGYEHYEISNFALPGYECKHNLNFWNGEEYIGIGAGAHSFFQNQRYSNVENIELYIEKIKKNQKFRKFEKRTKNDEIIELIMLGLRLKTGLDLRKCKNKCCDNIAENIINKAKEEHLNKLIMIENNNIFLTNAGIDNYNFVISELVDNLL